MLRLNVEGSGWLGILAAVCVAAIVATALPAVVRAAPLDDKTCDALRKQQMEAANSDARRNLSRGAAWAKDNLSAEKIIEVLKLLELDEKVAFRCPVKQAAKPKPKAENGKSNGKDSAGKAPAKPEVKRATATQPKPVPQAKPRSKVNDAFVPPPKRSGQSK